MKKHLLEIIILASAVAVSVILIGQATAQETGGQSNGMANIQYPVKELGNCGDENDCKFYCDEPDNLGVCLNFAEKNNLMNQEEIKTARQFQKAGNEGPGGCTGKNSCEKYCEDISHINECIAFAEENNLLPPDELAEAKKVKAAIDKGIKPPACGNKDACDAYCSSPEHMEECIGFAEAAGFMSGEELEQSKKMLTAIKSGAKPPPCNGKDACDAYCSQPDNMQTCMEFAMAAGLMSEQEKSDSEKMMQALKKGIKPPACGNKEECDVYCSQDEHFEECTNFAVAAGFMSEKDAEMSRKTGGKGPGGCKNKEECEAFCNNPDNQQTCFQFSLEHGLIPQEELEKIEQGKQQFKESLNQAGPEVSNCLKSALGEEVFNKVNSGEILPSQDLGEKMKQCFEANMQQDRMQNEMTAPGTENQQGPPGQFGPPGQPGDMQPGIRQDMQGQNQMMGPDNFGGGPNCSSPEECKNLFPGQEFNQPMMQNPQFEIRDCSSGDCPPSPSGEFNQQTIDFNKPLEGMNQQQQFNGPVEMQQFNLPPQGTQEGQFIQPPQGEGQMPPPPADGSQPAPSGEPLPPPPMDVPPPTIDVPPPATDSPPPSGAISPDSLFGFIIKLFDFGR